ncbi:MAG: hypothetical protein GXZ15_05950 [Campylobacter sp.]|nr:hypothetical protein [Campylobacter sp.]
MAKDNEKKTFWPYAILICFLFIIMACVATVVIAVKNPLHMDTYYLENSESVDRNIIEIEASQERFDEKFSVTLVDKFLAIGKLFEAKVIVEPKNKDDAKEITGEILLTRPDTSEFDKSLNFNLEDNTIFIEEFKVDKPGRWQLLLKLNDGTDTGFYKFELFAS